MNEQDQELLLDMGRRLFADCCDAEILAAADRGEWPTTLWEQLEETGLLSMLLEEEAGGIGASPAALAAILRVAGRHGAPGPLAETMVARMLIAQAGGDVPAGPLLLAIDNGAGDMLHVRAAPAAHLAILTKGAAPSLHILSSGDFAIEGRSTNIGGEEMFALSRTSSSRASSDKGTQLSCPPAAALRAEQLLSLARGALILGACERIMELSLAYVGDRVQFGRAIGKFQAVQQQLAALAGAVAAGSAILAAAARAKGDYSTAMMLHAARVRLADTADEVAAIGHQVHGAIGFTKEYALQLFTRRLWAWRSEATDLGDAAEALAASCAGADADTLWQRITALSADAA